jgi:hypothetical protein
VKEGDKFTIAAGRGVGNAELLYLRYLLSDASRTKAEAPYRYERWWGGSNLAADARLVSEFCREEADSYDREHLRLAHYLSELRSKIRKQARH